MPKKVPSIQRIINNDILKIVNIVFSRGGSCPPAPAPTVYGPVSTNESIVSKQANLGFNILRNIVEIDSGNKTGARIVP
jgi:hypothetical protein